MPSDANTWWTLRARCTASPLEAGFLRGAAVALVGSIAGYALVRRQDFVVPPDAPGGGGAAA